VEIFLDRNGVGLDARGSGESRVVEPGEIEQRAAIGDLQPLAWQGLLIDPLAVGLVVGVGEAVVF
jgi:hypothetical protein